MKNFPDFFEEEFGEYLDISTIKDAKNSIGKKLNYLCLEYIKNIELLLETKITFSQDNMHIKAGEITNDLMMLPENLNKKGIDLITRIVFCGILSRVMGTVDFMNPKIGRFFESILFQISVMYKK